METPEPSQRRRLVPIWAIVVPVALVALVAAVTVFLVVSRQTALVSVPNVTQLDVAVARSRLGESGLSLTRGDRRFSQSVPLDGVVDQSPAPGAKVPRGSSITVIISAGSESFAMPEVAGVPLQTARETLQAKGLVVETEVVASSRPKNTVVSSTPAAGVTVSSSDTVKLAVSSGSEGTSTLQPAKLDGRVFIIDPAPPSTGATDAPMEIERRLDSLLQASGAKVFVTRSIVDTGAVTIPSARALRARTASATAVIGLEVRPKGAGGISIATMQPLKVSSATYLGSVQLAQSLARTLGRLQPAIRSAEEPADPVLQAVVAPGVRLMLGSATDKKDAKHMSDPAWEDSVAAAIYTALAQAYGAR
jgi:N-acetylmuramoyl-L-alanine amidase